MAGIDVREFGFNASAVAFGGLMKPRGSKKHAHIKGKVPSVALAPAGGEVSAKGGYKNKKDGIEFDDATTIVTGDNTGDTLFTTVSETTLQGLNVFGRLKADLVRLKIKSVRDLENDDDSRFTIDAAIQGLTFDGKPIGKSKGNVPLDLKLFAEVPTYSDFIKRFFTKRRRTDEFDKRFGWDQFTTNLSTQELAAAAQIGAARPIRCSLVTTAFVEESEAMAQVGYAVDIRDFGRIYLAEVLVKPGRRRVNMIRLEDVVKSRAPRGGTAGRATKAEAEQEGFRDTYDATFVTGEGNGSNSWPP